MQSLWEIPQPYFPNQNNSLKDFFSDINYSKHQILKPYQQIIFSRNDLPINTRSMNVLCGLSATKECQERGSFEGDLQTDRSMIFMQTIAVRHCEKTMSSLKRKIIKPSLHPFQSRISHFFYRPDRKSKTDLYPPHPCDLFHPLSDSADNRIY